MLRLNLYFQRLVVYGLIAVSVMVWSAAQVFAGSKNGFDLSNASIPEAQILQGGPPRDGIPAIDTPKFVNSEQADFLSDDDRVLGVVRNGIAKAYSISILNWHEIVNDEFSGEGIAITFCPLCGTGMAFKSDINGERYSFGVSGLLYNSDVLLYDRGTESLWSQVIREAVAGPFLGTRLEMVATSHTTWQDWRQRYPNSLVLSTETGHYRDYDRNPYAGYETSSRTYFPVPSASKRFHPKEFVIGLELDGKIKAYPFSELAKHGKPVQDQVAGQAVRIEYEPEHRTGRVIGQDGSEIPTVIAFWFAWSAFYPDGEVFLAQ